MDQYSIKMECLEGTYIISVIMIEGVYIKWLTIISYTYGCIGILDEEICVLFREAPGDSQI
jgi:hypothetical protein